MKDLPEQDLCAELLSPGLPSPAKNEFRQDLLRRTSRLLRRRVWFKRAALAAALAACFLSGMATMHGLTPASETKDDQFVEHKPPKESDSVPITQPNEDPAPALEADTSPDILENWGPLVAPEKRLAVYRRAGVAYAESNDLQAALRCFRKALDAGSEQDLTIAPDDHWLLMSLKDARKKENLHARSN